MRKITTQVHEYVKTGINIHCFTDLNDELLFKKKYDYALFFITIITAIIIFVVDINCLNACDVNIW